MISLLFVPDFVMDNFEDEYILGEHEENEEDYDDDVYRSRSRSRRVSRSRSRTPRSRSRSRSRDRRSRSPRRHSKGQPRNPEADLEEARLLVEHNMFKLCDTHGLDVQPGSACTKCQLLTRTVGKHVLPEVLRILKQKAASTSDIPPAVERYAGRLDEKSPTLTFSESDLALAASVFGRGKMVPSNLFDELTNEFLFLPASQNEVLTKAMQLESLFNKFKTIKNFAGIFSYIEKLARVAKHFRISERPVILAMGELTRYMNDVRCCGKDLGFQYPEVPPQVQLLGPRKVQDRLAYSQLPPLSPASPLLEDLLRDTAVSPEDRAIIAANLDTWRESSAEQARDLASKLGGFMDLVSMGVNRLDSFLGFHLDLFAHCDGELAELMREKAIVLFSPAFRAAARGDPRKAAEGEEEVAGLLGGDNSVRSRLQEAAKEDELLAKTMVKARKTPQSRGGGRTKRPHRSRSRSRRRSSSRTKRDRSRTPRGSRQDSGSSSRQSGRGRGSRPRGGKSSSGNNNNSGKKDDPEKKDGPGKEAGKSKDPILSSPSSFTEAWGSSFFSASAIMLLTSLGFIVDSIPALDNLPLGGRLRHCTKYWQKVCSNSWVCDVISKGYKIPFRYVPSQRFCPQNPKASGPAFEVLKQEASDLLFKESIASVASVEGQYVSSYFAVAKARSPGKFRPILNLKKFNKSVKKYKFRMEGIRQVREWIQKDAFFCGMDLKDAFLHIPIHKSFKKFLRFQWLESLFEWQVLPFGLRCSPRVLTKVLRPVIAFIRDTWGILISIYMDDILIQGSSSSQALLSAQITALLLMVLGWSLNWKKSDFIPKQEVTHLGFIWNSVHMTISCPPDKVAKLQAQCRNLVREKVVTVWNAEKIMGTMESVRPVTPLCAMHYRSLQKQLLKAKAYRRRPNQLIVLSSKTINSLSWWISPAGFAAHATAPIREPEPSLEIWTDASLIQGGGHSSRGDYVQRAWSSEDLETNPSINLLETRAAREAVLALAEPDDSVRLYIDNRTAAAYIRCQGGTRNNALSQEALLLWEQAVSNDITLLTPYWIPTEENTEADFLSRYDVRYWDIMLDRETFRSILNHFHLQPTLDAFASRSSAQLSRYMSWERDPQAVGQNALIQPWDPVTYLFPPVPLLSSVIRQIEEQQIRAILICPQRPSALWWTSLMKLMEEPPLQLPYFKQCLRALNNDLPLPYLDPLVALHVSGKSLTSAQPNMT